MRKNQKIFVCVLALLFSLCAVGIGYGLVGDSNLSRWERFVCDFIFIMQFLATMWTAAAVFRTTKKQEKNVKDIERN